MLSGAKAKMMQRAAAQMDVRESGLAQRLTNEMALYEHQQARAVAALADAAGFEGEVPVPDPDERQQRLLDAAEATSSQQFPVWWWKTVAPEQMDNPEIAAQSAGIGRQEYHDLITDWCRRYYDRGAVDTPPEEMDAGQRARIVQQHLAAVHDVTARTWVEDVVNWDAQRALRGLLAGPIQSNTATIWAVADALDA
ncbi:hypothetical protein [Salinirussus salinus]|uniref:hypothetical protein n=1 Tax=Salinirussus salinus TaxID=1198300 RepID=UPI00135CCCF9|nr:hypothetical protein [Salinirussus salinus]